MFLMVFHWKLSRLYFCLNRVNFFLLYSDVYAVFARVSLCACPCRSGLPGAFLPAVVRVPTFLVYQGLLLHPTPFSRNFRSLVLRFPGFYPLMGRLTFVKILFFLYAKLLQRKLYTKKSKCTKLYIFVHCAVCVHSLIFSAVFFVLGI